MKRRGYTLLELVVVLMIMGLAAALVLPALRSPRPDGSRLNSLLAQGRAIAAQRGEVIYLHIAPTGEWHVEVGGSIEGVVSEGQTEPVVTAPVTLVVSPTGSCVLDVRSAATTSIPALDPLDCEARGR
jgi:prepilin-type N-terminal cleavage/methylation domain-containing protein